MNRLEEFTRDGKVMVYIDFSNFSSNEELKSFIESAKPVMKKYSPNSVYTITNMEGIVFNKATHEIIAEWVEHNKPYVKYGAVFGVDGVKKTLAQTIAIITKRKNLIYVSSKEEAIDSLLKQD